MGVAYIGHSNHLQSETMKSVTSFEPIDPPVVSTITGVKRTVVVASELKAEDKDSVFQQLRRFRSQVPKDILRNWEEPTGYESVM